jgi:folate-binding protein YgfZ
MSAIENGSLMRGSLGNRQTEGMLVDESWLPPRDEVIVEGPDAVSYVHSQVTQDIAAMAVGDVCWTFVLEPTGKIVSLARVRRVGEQRLELDTDRGYGDELLARLNRFRIRVKAELTLVPGDDGADFDEASRVAAGWPRLGAEIVPGETLVAGTGLSGLAVSFTKGCYPGQELVERMDSRGAEAPRQLRRVPAGTDDPAVEITSTAGEHALAWVKRGHPIGTPVDF